MTTKYKLIFEGDHSHIDLNLFQQALPDNFLVERENEDVFILAETQREEDSLSQYTVERELERIFFLTNVKIQAEIVRKRSISTIDMPYRHLDDLPAHIKPQNWTYELPVQLKLWSMADFLRDIRLQVLYYFHIIELSYPDSSSYPKYTDSSQKPHPLSECKFLRHLIAHAGEVSSHQLKLYCAYLDIPELMFDATDSQYQGILLRKIDLLKEQAKIAIEESIVRLNPELSDFMSNRYVRDVSVRVCSSFERK